MSEQYIHRRRCTQGLARNAERKPYRYFLTSPTLLSQPGNLFVYRWRLRPVYLRLVQGDDGAPPPCPVLYDDVLEIPVAANGQPPRRTGVRRIPLVADWLRDIVDEDPQPPRH